MKCWRRQSRTRAVVTTSTALRAFIRGWELEASSSPQAKDAPFTKPGCIHSTMPRRNHLSLHPKCPSLGHVLAALLPQLLSSAAPTLIASTRAAKLAGKVPAPKAGCRQGSTVVPRIRDPGRQSTLCPSPCILQGHFPLRHQTPGIHPTQVPLLPQSPGLCDHRSAGEARLVPRAVQHCIHEQWGDIIICPSTAVGCHHDPIQLLVMPPQGLPCLSWGGTRLDKHSAPRPPPNPWKAEPPLMGEAPLARSINARRPSKWWDTRWSDHRDPWPWLVDHLHRWSPKAYRAPDISIGLEPVHFSLEVHERSRGQHGMRCVSGNSILLHVTNTHTTKTSICHFWILEPKVSDTSLVKMIHVHPSLPNSTHV